MICQGSLTTHALVAGRHRPSDFLGAVLLAHWGRPGTTSNTAKTPIAATVTCPLGKLLSVYGICWARSGRPNPTFNSCASAAATTIRVVPRLWHNSATATCLSLSPSLSAGSA
ncbi:hypothetical protein [Kibdelosporangium philippinense]|uniref:hypothetical protein n=1 Tax=Kibdelosporangium philippinense TaxID=211113 RepID=UPI0036067BD2